MHQAQDDESRKTPSETRALLFSIALASPIKIRKSATKETVAALRALQVTVRATKSRTPLSLEILIAGFALVALLAAQWMLSAAIHGTNYYGVDGKMAQATILTVFEFGSRFEINNLNPIEGVGSQLLPMNVWANPAV